MGGGWSDGTLAHLSSGSRYDEVEANAASCVLWCTVALGYLVCGRPKEAVSLLTLVTHTTLVRKQARLWGEEVCLSLCMAVAVYP